MQREKEKLDKMIKKAADAIAKADAVIITAGAGMGVDSGLPDFRGVEGFWKAYPPIAKLGYDFIQMANPTLFRYSPKLAWGFYGHRLNLYRKTKPHEGFRILLDLVATKDNNYFIYTSNVDGQFQKAGFDEDRICEVHGSIHYLQCTKPCTIEIWENDLDDIEIDMDKLEAKSLPKCKNCDELARPNILMFGDGQFIDKRSEKQNERFRSWLISNQDKNTAIIDIGAGTAIPTIRNFGDRYTGYDNYTLIRINPREFDVYNGGDIGLPFGGLEGLKKIKAALDTL